uniref:Acid phosphatase n=1 Tax=Euplotes crassus TaxID=5936 RepID=A0A7S3KP79_EUPCR
MLTASGFRQQFLLGSELRRRYVQGYPNQDQFLNQFYDPDEIYVRSTQTKRTVQSAYAQLLGLYPLDSAEFLDSGLTDVAVPPIQVFNLKDVQERLGIDPILDNPQPIPVFNFDQQVDTFVAYGDCPFISNEFFTRNEQKELWADLDEKFRPLIFKQIAQAFGADSGDLHFIHMGPLIDILFAEEFEGIQNRFNFTEEEWEIVLSMHVPSLSNRLSDKGTQLLALRHILPILETMKKKIGLDYQEDLISRFGDSKMLMISSHDAQLIFILRFLNPEGFELTHVPYASTLIFELRRFDTNACHIRVSRSCFYVRILFNDEQLKLPGCAQKDCTFREFSNYIQTTGISYQEVQEQCQSEELLQNSDSTKSIL